MKSSVVIAKFGKDETLIGHSGSFLLIGCYAVFVDKEFFDVTRDFLQINLMQTNNTTRKGETFFIRDHCDFFS